jgi:predicted GIY-YIG superfamily endonuclease
MRLFSVSPKEIRRVNNQPESREGTQREKIMFTRGGRPWILVHVEECGTISEARKRELHLKSGIGRAWLDSKFRKTKRSIR